MKYIENLTNDSLIYGPASDLFWDELESSDFKEIDYVSDNAYNNSINIGAYMVARVTYPQELKDIHFCIQEVYSYTRTDNCITINIRTPNSKRNKDILYHCNDSKIMDTLENNLKIIIKSKKVALSKLAQLKDDFKSKYQEFHIPFKIDDKDINELAMAGLDDKDEKSFIENAKLLIENDELYFAINDKKSLIPYGKSFKIFYTDLSKLYCSRVSLTPSFDNNFAGVELTILMER
ncbi:MAG: hypothetical protein J6V68_04490 [Clostridia bacterium]|nr:hypothetical protein [Clostridia bacterium]